VGCCAKNITKTKKSAFERIIPVFLNLTLRKLVPNILGGFVISQDTPVITGIVVCSGNFLVVQSFAVIRSEHNS
jgi:hypothetical protein